MIKMNINNDIQELQWIILKGDGGIQLSIFSF